MRVLIAAWDVVEREELVERLRLAGWTASATDHGWEAAELAGRFSFDAIVACRDLVDGTAFELAAALRGAGVPTPLIVLGTLGVAEQVRALNAGADDAQPTPVHVDELVARLHAIVRRDRRVETLVRVGPITVDLRSRELILDGRTVHLSVKVYQVLETLALRAGHLVERGALLDALYRGDAGEPDPKVIDVFLVKLRRALGPHRGLIETVWGKGWRLGAPAPEAPMPASGWTAEIGLTAARIRAAASGDGRRTREIA